MVTRKSVTRATMAERYFPVRIRVAVPLGGFGSQLNAIYAWLDQHIGRDHYWGGGGSRTYGAEAVYFYFLTVDSAKAFIDRFACGLSIEGEWQAPIDRYGRDHV